MSELLTVASLPGEFGSGLMEWGRLSRGMIIQRLREKAAHDKERAERILAATDEDFNVRVVRGPRVQKLVERL